MKRAALVGLLVLGTFLVGAASALADSYSYVNVIDPSATGYTAASGINNLGEVVGVYGIGLNTYGFSDSAGVFTTINDSNGSGSTFANGVNDSGLIVGGYFDSASNQHGFTDAGGTLTTIVDNGGAFGVNNAGQIVGGLAAGTGYVDTAGVFHALNFPGASATAVEGINNTGSVVGYYVDASGNTHGFVYNGTTFSTIDDPLAAEGTILYGINDSGKIVGTYTDASGVGHGFVYSGGLFTALSDPLGTLDTVAFGIDNAGDVVGSYDFSTVSGATATNGFVATPTVVTTPEPETLAMLGIALLCLGAFSRRKLAPAQAD